MRIASISASFAYIGFTVAAARTLTPRQTSSDQNFPVVPAYNVSIPVDHFASSDTRTYENRFYVNDTYYKPGGPVIVHGNGESSLRPLDAASTFAEYNDWTSGSIELAKLINGVVIGWEHRYYGSSLPVSLDENGIPLGGTADYQFLTIEQAMEDLVYFANNFNQSKLPLNNVIQSTEKLDPYNTPWIYIGGSYSGALAGFLRQRNPEIFYATWSSSGPVQAQYDGTAYYNQLYRTLPSNCSTDIKAVLQSFDAIIASGDQTQITGFTDAAWQSNNLSSISDSEKWGPGLAGIELANAFVEGFQYYGPTNTTHWFCDLMESFDGVAYQKSVSSSSGGLENIFSNRLETPFNRLPADGGLIEAYGQSGIMVAQAAYLYAMDAYSKYWVYNTSASAPSIPRFTASNLTDFNEAVSVADNPSWVWQTISELGYQRGYNDTTNHGMQLVLKVSDNKVDRDHDILGNFPSLDYSTFPTAPNSSAALKYGGWDMKPSNVMFTNGELDPWRSFSVMSTEQQIGAPKRNIVQTPPKCNEAPSGTDLFGMLYPDRVHCTDITGLPRDGSPIYQSAKLFADAYNAWQPCFNKSRDDVRNGKAPDGSAKSNSAGVLGISHMGMWTVIAASIFMHSLL